MNTVFINNNLLEGTISLYSNESSLYYEKLEESIKIAILWLETNVLCNPNDGYHVRKRLSKGTIRYTSQMNKYLVNSCRYWRNELTIREYNNRKLRSGAPLPYIDNIFYGEQTNNKEYQTNEEYLDDNSESPGRYSFDSEINDSFSSSPPEGEPNLFSKMDTPEETSGFITVPNVITDRKDTVITDRKDTVNQNTNNNIKIDTVIYSENDVDLNNVYISSTLLSPVDSKSLYRLNLMERLKNHYNGYPYVKVSTNTGDRMISLCEVIIHLKINYTV